MLKKLFISLIFAITLLSTTTIPAFAQSGSIVDTTGTTASGTNKYNTGDYTLDDMVMIAIRASRWILGVVGSLALLMFVYGGFMFLISSGSSDKINKAKTILIAAVVGLVIVFGSYLIIKFVLQTVGINWDGSKQIITQSYSQERLS